MGCGHDERDHFNTSARQSYCQLCPPGRASCDDVETITLRGAC